MGVKQRHKKVLKNLEKSRTEQEALEKAGYSPSYAKSGQIKSTKSWQELLEKNLPDKLLAKVHREGLSATKNQGVGIGADGEVQNTKNSNEVPDFPTRHKYLDTAYKIKGKLSDKPEVNIKLEGIEFKVQK